MINEIGFSTQIKDLTVVITYASVVKLKELVEAIQKTDGGAMTFDRILILSVLKKTVYDGMNSHLKLLNIILGTDFETSDDNPVF